MALRGIGNDSRDSGFNTANAWKRSPVSQVLEWAECGAETTRPLTAVRKGHTNPDMGGGYQSAKFPDNSPGSNDGTQDPDRSQPLLNSQRNLPAQPTADSPAA